jgi:hypothetical protein
LDGGDTLKVRTIDLTTEQSKQVFHEDEVRTLGAQRAWLEDQKRKQPSDPDPANYEVKKGKLVVREPMTFTKSQLRSLLLSM